MSRKLKYHAPTQEESPCAHLADEYTHRNL
jgi:hypothetical protein